MKFSFYFFRFFLQYAIFFVALGSCHQGLSKKEVAPLIERVDPPFWWVGMKNSELELVFHGKRISRFEINLQGYDSRILEITRPSNPDYVFVRIEIGANQQPGNLNFSFSAPKMKPYTLSYALKQRDDFEPGGLNPGDLIYLAFPDRFSNGDLSNDRVVNMKESGVDRKGLKTRHGGDLQGVINHLDYIESLGTTALWLNPVLENDQPYESYHGYAFTDHYKVDPRLGSNALYKALTDSLHNRGMKAVWDVVYNHIGNEHYLFRNLPDSNWVHWYPGFTRTNYRAETLMDPYSSASDRDLMTNAWFDKHMPDLNQQDEHLARYLIQNSIWWIEFAHIDAFRIDTYAYPDQQFMKRLNESILEEYPSFMLFGETWVQGSPIQAWFTGDSGLNKQFNSSLHGVTDFQLFYAITNGLNENFGWENGFRRVELTLSHDYMYANPYMNVTHLDNHDLSRFYSVIQEDISKWKMGMAMLYTLRGIPQIYYGTEILMKNYSDPDAKVREDFPGGWQGDSTNKFLTTNLTAKELEAFQFCQKLGQFRKSNPWFGSSKLTQFVPDENTWVYFRHDNEHLVMCVYNGNDKPTELYMQRFSEMIQGHSKVNNIISGVEEEIKEKWTAPARSVTVFEFLN